MTNGLDPIAWASFLLGLFTIVAGIGALRQPGLWKTAVDEIIHSPALQILSGLLEILVGSLVYLSSPWNPDDLLSCIMKALGGMMMAEALMVVGFCDIYSQFWLRNLANFQRGWAMVSIVAGVGLALAGAMRFSLSG